MEKMYDELLVEERTHNGKQRVYIDAKPSLTSFQKISWPAIFGGVAVTIVAQLLFTLLGMGIGLGTIDLSQESRSLEDMGMRSTIWWSISMLIALFLGGMTTANLYQPRNKTYSTWHGLLTWCTFTIVSFLMLTSTVGKLVSGAGNVFGAAFTAGISTAQNNNGYEPGLSGIVSEVRNLLGSNVSTTPGTVNNRNFQSGVESNNQSTLQSSGLGVEDNQNNQFLINKVQSFFRSDNPTTESREALVNTLVSQTGMSRIEAANKLDQWSRTYETLKAEAKVKAEEAAKEVSTASIVVFFALIIGALVTIWGAWIVPTRESVRVEQ